MQVIHEILTGLLMGFAVRFLLYALEMAGEIIAVQIGLSMSTIKEPMDTLEQLAIQVDGANERYMLQIFMAEGGLLYDDPRAGPFFYEIIQRAGDPGFGYGNFRALFESIERDQKARATPTPTPAA